MREQPHHEHILTEDFFLDHYVEKKMSYPKIALMLKEQGHNIATGTIHKYAKKLGIGRNRSEAKRNCDPNPLDFSKSYLTERTIEAIDGFLLGDGHISKGNCAEVPSARLSASLEHEIFCKYLMSFFHRYQPNYGCYNCSSMKCGKVWNSKSKYHPDLYKQWKRWYEPNIDGLKQPPSDVRITPLSVMIWYLGDGSLVQAGDSISVRLSTDGFAADFVDYLSHKLRDKSIDCHRNSDNRIYVEAKGVPAFFDFIGRKSPVTCYDYKFDLPEWRFEAKRMKQVSDELSISYDRLAHLVKVGRLPCFRASPKGKPRFLSEHVAAAKEYFESGKKSQPERSEVRVATAQ